MQNHHTIYMHVITVKKVTRLIIMIEHMVFQRFPIAFFQLHEDFNIIKLTTKECSTAIIYHFDLICNFTTGINIAL